MLSEIALTLEIAFSPLCIAPTFVLSSSSHLHLYSPFGCSRDGEECQMDVCQFLIPLSISENPPLSPPAQLNDLIVTDWH